MKNVISYALGFLVIATAAQAAPRMGARSLPKASSLSADRQAVSQARVKLMNDARKLGPSAPQVQADKTALIQALEKLKGDEANTGGRNRPVNVKRIQKKGAKRARITKHKHPVAGKRSAHRKVSHRAARKRARVA